MSGLFALKKLCPYETEKIVFFVLGLEMGF